MADLYVSNSGSDSNPGTEAAPLKTGVKAISKKPARIFLKRGNTFPETFSLYSGVKIFDYGTADAKPVIVGQLKLGRISRDKNNPGYSVDGAEVNNVITRAPSTVNRSSEADGVVVAGSNNIFNGVESHGWVYGWNLASKLVVDGGGVRGVGNKLRKCVAYGCWGNGKSQGIYATHQDGLEIGEGTTIRKCGWKDAAFTNADQYIHGFYGSESNGPVTANGLNISRCGNFGWQCRSGGTLKNARIEDTCNAVKMGDNDSILEDVVILDSHQISSGSAGWGVFAMRVPNLTLRRVFIGYKTAGDPTGEAIKIENWADPYIPSNAWSIANAKNHVASKQNILLDFVTVFEWPNKGLRIPQIANGSTLTIQNSKFYLSGVGAYAADLKIGAVVPTLSNNEVAVARNPNSLKNGAGWNMANRVAFTNIPRPA